MGREHRAEQVIVYRAALEIRDDREARIADVPVVGGLQNEAVRGPPDQRPICLAMMLC